MLNLPDPLSDILGVFFKKAVDSKIGRRVDLLIELFVSGTASFCIICGAVAAATHSWFYGVVNGLWISGGCVIVTFRKSKNSEGLIIATPTDEKAKEAIQDAEVLKK